MKKTIAKTKLVLNQETIRDLSAQQLRYAAGGIVAKGPGPCSAQGSGCLSVGLSDDNCPPTTLVTG